MKTQPMIAEQKGKVATKLSRWGSGRGGRPWERKRQRIFLRDNYTCQHCFRPTVDLECDHIVNLAQGGSDDDSNLQSLCVPCHKIKTAKEARFGG